MKNLITFAIIILTGLAASGQTTGHFPGISPAQRQGNALPDPLGEYRAKAGITSRLTGFGNKQQRLYANAHVPLNPSDVRFNWDTAVLSDTAGPADKYIRALDDRGKVLSELNYVMNNGNWLLFSRLEYMYDAGGKQISQYNVHWVNGAWVFFTRDTITYDASGNCLETVIQTWSSGAWQNIYKYYFSYDAAGNAISEGDALWSNGAWVNETRNTYTLDAQGKVVTSLYEVWQNGTWSAHGFETNTYDASGRLQIEVGQIWKNGAWVNSSRTAFTYNAASQELLKLYETWDTVSQLWINYLKYSSSFDVNGNLVALLKESWDALDNAWINMGRWRYQYDAAGNSTDEICEIWKAGNWAPGMSSLNLFSRQELVYTFWWPLRHQYHATFKSYVSGVDEKSGNMAFSVYPNPAGEKLTIACNNPRDGQQVTIYDMQGRPVMQSVVTGTKCELNISRLAPGNYLVRLPDEKQAGGATFVKK